MMRRRDAAAAADLPQAETTTMGRFEMPRRVVDVPVAPSHKSHGHQAATGRVALGTDFGPVLVHDGATQGAPEPARQLAVGRGIRLTGEIEGCERLSIEGELKCGLHACEQLVIADGGRLEGQSEVETADIAGVFEGTLLVRGRLLIRATGRVRGDIRFGELEIERGGQLAGSVDAHAKGPQLATVTAAGGD